MTFYANEFQVLMRCKIGEGDAVRKNMLMSYEFQVLMRCKIGEGDAEREIMLMS